MLAGLSFWHAGASQVVLLGPPEREDTQALFAAIASRYLPFALIVPVARVEAQTTLATAMPFVSAMKMIDNRATAFVCRDFSCRQPVNTPSALATELEAI
jgi:hypothetical protein